MRYKDLTDDQLRAALAIADYDQDEMNIDDFTESWQGSDEQKAGMTLLDYVIDNDQLKEMDRQELLELAGCEGCENEEVAGEIRDYLGITELIPGESPMG